MPTGTVNATANKIAQIGPEVTAGTAVAATKQIIGASIQPGIKFNAKAFRAEGRKYPFVVVPGKEWSEHKITGPLNYTELVYWLCSAEALVTPTTHAGGSTSKDWTFTSLLTGNNTLQTYTLEKGDSVRAQKYAYCFVTGYDIHYTKDSVDFTATMMGQQVQDGITLTSSLSPVAVMPVFPAHVNMYIDTTSGNIGTTQALDVLEATFSKGNIYGPYWTFNRTNSSFAKHVDLAPNCTFKISQEADSVGLSPLTGVRTGSTYYFMVDAQGPIIEAAIPYEHQLKFAGKCTAITGFADDNGVYKIEWTFTIVEDTGLAYAMKQVVTNLLTAL